MATSRVLSRLSSRIHFVTLKLRKNSVSTDTAPFKSISQSQLSSSRKRISGISRLPLELSSLESMMPLHSAIASARLKSSLSAESQCWGLVPQGRNLNGLYSFKATTSFCDDFDEWAWR